MNNEQVKKIVSSRDDLLMLDYIIEGYGFKDKKDFLNSSLGKMNKESYIKAFDEQKEKVKELCDYMDSNVSKEQAIEILNEFHVHQFKFAQFKHNNKLDINIFVETQYEKQMDIYPRELFFPTQLILIDKIQEKFKLNKIQEMSKEEILEQHEKISQKMCVNPQVQLVYREDIPKKKTRNKKKI